MRGTAYSASRRALPSVARALAMAGLITGGVDVAHAQVFLEAMGGGGGGQWIATCPEGQNLAGFELRAGDDIDAIRSLCVVAYSDNEVTTPVLTSDSGLVQTSDGQLGIPSWRVAPGWYGGPGGNLRSVVCPMASPIVIGIDIASEGNHTITVNTIHLFCGRASPAKSAASKPSAISGTQIAASRPSAIFEAPQLYPNIEGAQKWESQRCPPGMVAVGAHGRGGVWIDAVGLICAAPRISARPPGYVEPIAAVGRVHGESAGPALSICEAAKAARERNSPAAPGLEAQCDAQSPKIEAVGRVQGEAAHAGAPIPICDSAGIARDRNSPAAPGLAQQCLALGGRLPPPAIAAGPTKAELELKGKAIANSDPLSAALRIQQRDGAPRRGFDIGMAANEGHTAWGPGKQKTLDSLSPAEQEGFKVASSFSLDRNRNFELAAVGASIAASDTEVAKARSAEPDARYWLGFDIATGIFGDPALGARGNTATGPGSLKIRDGLSAPAQRGFNAAVTLHLSRRS